MAVKMAVVMKDIMTLSLPLIFLFIISGESQLLQHHFKMFSVIAHIKNIKKIGYILSLIFFLPVSACQSLCMFTFAYIRLAHMSLEGGA